MKRRFYLSATIITICLALSFHSTISFAGGKDISVFKTFDKNEKLMAQAINVDSDGNVYMLLYDTDKDQSQMSNVIRKYDPHGNLIRQWPCPLYWPQGICVDSQGYSYVADIHELVFPTRISKFDSSGTLVKQWSVHKDNGSVSLINAAVDAKSNVYTFMYYPEMSSDKLVGKYSSAGKFITSWGRGKKDVEAANGMAVDSKGNVYLYNGETIGKYDSKGTFITKWHSAVIGGVKVDSQDNVYAVILKDDTPMNVRAIQKFSPEGKLISQWDVDIEVDTNLSGHNFAVTPAGDAVYLINVNLENIYDRRILKVDLSGALMPKDADVTQGITATDQAEQPSQVVAEDSKGTTYVTDSQQKGDLLMYLPRGIAADSASNIYVADGNQRIKKFTSTGKFIMTWGSANPREREQYLRDLCGVAVDSRANVYALDVDRPISKLNSNGKVITTYEIPWDADFTNPTAITVDTLGNIYLLSEHDNCVLKLDSKGKFITKWGSEGLDNGQFTNPQGIAVDAKGNVYVTDGAHYIQKFDSSGKFIALWIPPGGVSVTSFMDMNSEIVLHGIATDARGNVYATDEAKCCVYKFDPSGTCIATWGSKGSGDGQFGQPWGITVDPQENVYVVDSENACVQKFDSEGKFITRWGAKGKVRNP